MKKILLVIIGISFAFSANATTIPEGAVIKTANNPDVYIVKYKNGKQFKRLVLNPQVFESYGHLRWENILTITQGEMNSFITSSLVRADGQIDVYQLIANGDTGSKHYLVSNNFDLDSVYTINSVDYDNYTMGEVKGVEDLIDTKDNDSDGLENWEEDQRGTNKNISDTDGDGIIDGLDSHPTGGGRLIAQHFEWDYFESIWTWDLSFPSDWYDYYKNKERKSHGADYVTYDDPYIKQIADMLEKKSDEKGYSKSEFAVAFIQSLGYVNDSVIGYDDYPKYPLETLAEQNGDCEDTSYLISAIVLAMDIDNVLVELPGHMAIAVAFSGSPEGYYYKLSNGWDYYYIETTAEGWEVGKIPDEYKNQKAKLVKIPSNETEEVKPSYIPFTNYVSTPSQNDSEKAEELQRTIKATQALEQLFVLINEADNQLDILDKQMEEKNTEIENTKNRTVSSYFINGKLAKLIPEYNSLVEQYNNQLELYKKIFAMKYVIEDYKNNIYITIEDRAFLGSLGINL
ncbi:MAG: hypothetical protein KAQ64_02475 [Candidatus Pacebacteria bacterium]|nr:hypothetical protein [Candidatus Paceibacterota bacterium]